MQLEGGRVQFWSMRLRLAGVREASWSQVTLRIPFAGKTGNRQLFKKKFLFQLPNPLLQELPLRFLLG
jgi:hypothetical protein